MYLFFFCQRGDGDICLTKPKDKESRQWIQFHLWWKLRFHLEKLLLYSDFFLYIIRCICCTVGCIRCTQNMSEIKVILVLSFLMHIYTQMLRVYVHNVIISAFQYRCCSCRSTCFKCSREITPASLMQLQHFIFTCLLQCNTAFFFLFLVYEINGNILYF